jgi:hypothetical protein
MPEFGAESLTGTNSVVTPEFPSATEASSTEMTTFLMCRNWPLVHVKLWARYFPLCAATHLPPGRMQTVRPPIRSETPLQPAAVRVAAFALAPVAASAISAAAANAIPTRSFLIP